MMGRPPRCHFRFVLVALFVLATAIGLLTAPGVAAQDNVVGSTYTSPTYGYSLTWEPDEWEVVEERSDGRYDVLALEALSQGPALRIRIDGDPDYGDDVEGCLEDYIRIESSGDSVSELEPLTDDSGQPIAGSADDRAYAAFALTVDIGDGETASGVFDIECRRLSDQAVVVVRTSTQRDYDDALAARNALLDGFVFPDGTGVPDRDDSADAAPTGEVTGVDGTTYTSPTWGYSFSWDEAAWVPSEASELVAADLPSPNDPAEVTADLDQLGLESVTGAGIITIQGYVGHDGDPTVCRDSRVEELSALQEVGEIVPFPDDDGNPMAGEDPDGWHWGNYAHVTFEGDEVDILAFLTVECRVLVPGEAVLFLLHRDDAKASDESTFSQYLEVRDSVRLAAEAPPLAPDRDAAPDGDEPDADGVAAPAGAVLLEDDFDDPSAGVIPTGSSDPSFARFAYEGGEYVIEKLDPDMDRTTALVPGTFADHTIAIDARVTGETSRRYVAIGCRTQEGLGGYELVIEPDAQWFGLFVWEDDEPTILAETSGSPVINPGDESNRLELTCQGDAISTRINGVEVASAQDSTYAEGNALFAVGVFQNALPAVAGGRFDNLAIIDASGNAATEGGEAGAAPDVTRNDRAPRGGSETPEVPDDSAGDTAADRTDTDGDGIADGLETSLTGTDPLNPDTDGDGASDFDETVAGTDPLDPGDTP